MLLSLIMQLCLHMAAPVSALLLFYTFGSHCIMGMGNFLDAEIRTLDLKPYPVLVMHLDIDTQHLCL
jgi:hypothetical protein